MSSRNSWRVRFVSKNQKSLTQRFPDLRKISKSIKAETAIIDGEIVALDKKGLPCFAGLRSGKVANECAIVFYAFDLLYLNADDLTQKPLNERKRLLKRILPKSDTGRVRYTEHIVGDGEGLFRELEKRKLEGMVAKRADSLYVGGRTRAWLKSRRRQAEKKCASVRRLGATLPANNLFNDQAKAEDVVASNCSTERYRADGLL